MIKRLTLSALVTIASCKSIDSKSSNVKSSETLEQLSINQNSVKILARCGSKDTECERRNTWHTIGLRYIASATQPAEVNARPIDLYFISVYVAEQSSKIFGKLNDINLGKIAQDSTLMAYGSSIFSSIAEDWGRLIYIGKLDDRDNLILEPGISIIPAVNDVRQNLWERYWKGLSDKRIPFLYLTYDKDQKYSVVTQAVVRENLPPKLTQTQISESKNKKPQ